MFLSKEEVISKIEEAIINRRILKIKYQHIFVDNSIVERLKAPFDIGTTNPQKIESYKNNLYAFCYNHRDEVTGLNKEIVHPVNIEHIISIEQTGNYFNENELADIYKTNSGYDYRSCKFALAPDRNWFK